MSRYSCIFQRPKRKKKEEVVRKASREDVTFVKCGVCMCVCVFTWRRHTYFTSLNLDGRIQWTEGCFTVWVGPGGVANGALRAQRGWSEPEKWERWECSVWSSASKDLYGQVVYLKNSLSTDCCRQHFNSTVCNIRPATAHTLSSRPVEKKL